MCVFEVILWHFLTQTKYEIKQSFYCYIDNVLFVCLRVKDWSESTRTFDQGLDVDFWFGNSNNKAGVEPQKVMFDGTKYDHF